MQHAADKTELFETMPVRQAVCRQIVPAVASQMIALVYSLADTYFVGMLNQPHQTAAITVVYSSFVMLTAISNLFGVGGASALSRALGTKNREGARQIAALSFWGGLICALLFSLLFLAFARPVLVLCGAVPKVYPIAFQYALWVVVIGGPAAILNTLLANLVRAQGNAAIASVGVSLGGVLNILLDPFFVLPGFLGMGAAGAGMATALSNLAATLYFLFYIAIRQKNTAVAIHPSLLKPALCYLKTILSTGLPSAVQYALTVVAIAAQSRFVSLYGTQAMAALGIVKKLDQLPLYFSIGVSSGILPLLAYNYSSGNHTRRRAVFRLGCAVSLSCLRTPAGRPVYQRSRHHWLRRRLPALYGNRHAHDVRLLSHDHPVSGHGKSTGVHGLFPPAQRGAGHPPSLFDERPLWALRLHVGTAHGGFHFPGRGRRLLQAAGKRKL